MKRTQLFLSFLLLPLDYALIVLAGWSAYHIRYSDHFQSWRPVIFDLPFVPYFQSVIFIALLWLVLFAFAGLYNIHSARKFIKEVFRVILACSTGFMLIVILIFFSRDLFDSRFIILGGWFLAIVYISLGRGLVRFVQRALFRYGLGVNRVILVGNSKTTDNLLSEFSRPGQSGFAVAKRVRDFSLETEKELRAFLAQEQIDEIIQSDPNLSKTDVLRLYDFADEYNLTFKYAADLLGTKVLKTEVMEIAGIPLIEVKKTPLEGWGRIAKRIMDVFGSSVLIFLFSPLLLGIALLIKIDSRGPVFYLDYRSGQVGRRFLFYKFRSMIAHLCDGEGPSATAEGNKILQEMIADRKLNVRSDQPLHKIKDDPRVTRVGRFIRRWSLDELPQLFNVLKGDISLVGPRPHMTMQTAKYEAHHKKVLTIKPGITGLAQISGRSDLSFEDEVKLDIYYIENWSLLLDLSILLRTPLAVIRKRQAL